MDDDSRNGNKVDFKILVPFECATRKLKIGIRIIGFHPSSHILVRVLLFQI